MEWQRDFEAAPGECASASPQRRRRVASLARLESPSSSARVYTTSASPTGGGATGTGQHSRSRWPAFASFQGITGALSAFVGDTAGSQCATSNGWPSDHSTVRRPRRVCRLAQHANSLHGSVNLAPPTVPSRFPRDVFPSGLQEMRAGQRSCFRSEKRLRYP